MRLMVLGGCGGVTYCGLPGHEVQHAPSPPADPPRVSEPPAITSRGANLSVAVPVVYQGAYDPSRVPAVPLVLFRDLVSDWSGYGDDECEPTPLRLERRLRVV
jgi:hypothetical protein